MHHIPEVCDCHFMDRRVYNSIYKGLYPTYQFMFKAIYGGPYTLTYNYRRGPTLQVEMLDLLIIRVYQIFQ